MLLKIPDIGARGLNSDIDNWDLTPEFISEGRNFRCKSGGIGSFGGELHIATPEANNYPGYMILARTKGGDKAVTAGSNGIYSYLGGTFTDITGPVLVSAGNEDDWSGALNGAITVLNNPDYYPVYWTGEESEDCILLPWNIVSSSEQTTWADVDIQCKVMRTHKNFFLALNLQEDIDYPDRVRWSSPAGENAIPFTWDEYNPSGVAGVQDLGGDGGAIIDGLSLRDSFVIYSEKAINILDLSGDEFIWSRTELSSTMGLLSKDCLVEVKGMHFFISAGDIVMFDGNQLTSIAHNIIQKRLNKRMNADAKDAAFAFRNDRYKEVWFCVPEDGATYASVAFIYNWKEQTWVVRDLPENTAYIAVSKDSTPIYSWADGETGPLSGSWESRVGSWADGFSEISLGEYPYAVINDTGELRSLDPNTQSETDLDTFIQRTGWTLVDQVAITTITRLYPMIKGDNELYIRVGSQDYPDSEVRWQGKQLYDPRSMRKIDVRTTGALHCWEFTSIGTGAFKLSGVNVDYQVDGIR